MKIACDRCDKIQNGNFAVNDWMRLRVNGNIDYYICPDCEKLFWRFIDPECYKDEVSECINHL